MLLIWGIHAVKAALAQKKRLVHRVLVTPSLQEQFKEGPCEVITPKALQALVPCGAVHQGVAAWVSPLHAYKLQDMDPQKGLVVALDGITDPHNVGALWRSAAAFGAQGFVVTKHNCPPLDGVVAKSACGALEWTPCLQVTNLVSALEELKKRGFFCVGLAEESSNLLSHQEMDPVVLVIGAEGKGLRRLTRERCDLLVSIPTHPSFPTLNASVAGGIALFHFSRLRG